MAILRLASMTFVRCSGGGKPLVGGRRLGCARCTGGGLRQGPEPRQNWVYEPFRGWWISGKVYVVLIRIPGRRNFLHLVFLVLLSIFQGSYFCGWKGMEDGRCAVESVVNTWGGFLYNWNNYDTVGFLSWVLYIDVFFGLPKSLVPRGVSPVSSHWQPESQFSR